MPDPEETIVRFSHERIAREKINRRFHQLKQELEMLIPGSDIQHVGSTAMPGSLTKGDLDIQVRVTMAEFARAKKRLCEIYEINDGGFVANDAISFEDYSGDPSLGIHLTVIGGSCDIQWKFRDLLIASAFLKKEYN